MLVCELEPSLYGCHPVSISSERVGVSCSDVVIMEFSETPELAQRIGIIAIISSIGHLHIERECMMAAIFYMNLTRLCLAAI